MKASCRSIYFGLSLVALLAFFIEVIIRLSSQCKGYCDSYFNVVDLVFLLLATASILMAYVAKYEPYTSLTCPFFVFVRYFVQSIRLVLVLRNRDELERKLIIAQQYPVDFESVQPDDALSPHLLSPGQSGSGTNTTATTAPPSARSFQRSNAVTPVSADICDLRRVESTETMADRLRALAHA